MRIEDLKPGEQVKNQVFMLKDYSKGVSSTGNAYLKVALSDTSGKITGMLWDTGRGDEIDLDRLPRGKPVKVSGEVENFKGHPVIRLDSLDLLVTEPIPEKPGYEKAPEKPSEDYSEAIIQRRKKQLVTYTSYVNDEMGGYCRKAIDLFSDAPGTVTGPYSEPYGLLNHTHRVATLVSEVSRDWDETYRKLGMAAAICHDVGKVIALKRTEDHIIWTEDGLKLGVPMLSALVVRAWMETPDRDLLSLMMATCRGTEPGTGVLWFWKALRYCNQADLCGWRES